jgi:Fe-S oxidoreductase
MGEVGLFEALAEENIAKFKKYNVRKIVTLSPHGFHALKNEYSKLDPGLKIEVMHYTQLLSDLLKEGKLKPTKKVNKKATYQDSCYLGKHNSIYEEPRLVLQSIPGLNYVEFDRCRERSLCCEGGGGRMWVEAFDAKDRTANIRVREAIDLGVEVIATACPFCLLTLEDAIKIGGYEEQLKVMDIMEILDQVLD